MTTFEVKKESFEKFFGIEETERKHLSQDRVSFLMSMFKGKNFFSSRK